jgi:hypothetical protein
VVLPSESTGIGSGFGDDVAGQRAGPAVWTGDAELRPEGGGWQSIHERRTCQRRGSDGGSHHVKLESSRANTATKATVNSVASSAIVWKQVGEIRPLRPASSSLAICRRSEAQETAAASHKYMGAGDYSKYVGKKPTGTWNVIGFSQVKK